MNKTHKHREAEKQVQWFASELNFLDSLFVFQRQENKQRLFHSVGTLSDRRQAGVGILVSPRFTAGILGGFPSGRERCFPAHSGPDCHLCL